MGTAPQRPGPLAGDSMVGRRRELDSLRSWLKAAHDGRGRLVVSVGEPGIGKTRLAQELAGAALAMGTPVVWGRCVEAEGAPAYWPWTQVLRSLTVDPDAVLVGDGRTPEDRFRVFDEVTAIVRRAADGAGLVVVLDDVHCSDESSLLLLRHLADRCADMRLLIYAAMREVAPSSVLPRVLPDLLRSPVVEGLHLRGLDLAGVQEQLSRAGARAADARAVLEATGGNPLFVREIGRAFADGTWRPDRPPRTVLDVVQARLARTSPGCRRFVQASAVLGRDFSLPLVAATLAEPIAPLLPLVDEAMLNGLIDRPGSGHAYRFVHALIRDAVEASLPSTESAALHRAAAEAITREHAGNLSHHLADIARHWRELAPYGESSTARMWTARAADEAVRRLAHEEAVRLYRVALSLDVRSSSDADRCGLLVALGRAAFLAGDIADSVEAVLAAREAAHAAASPELLGAAALVLEAVPDPDVNAVTRQVCEEALTGLADAGSEALRARLLAQRSHLAFYDGEQERVTSLSAAALRAARASGDPGALVDALHARKEACPGPAGRPERMRLSAEMLALAQHPRNPRTALWGVLWLIEGLIESGQLAAASDQLSALRVAVTGVGGPVSSWQLDRVTACVLQAQGRYSEAAAIGRRGFDRMRVVEPGPAQGSYSALQVALSRHVVLTDDAAEFMRRPFEPLPRFRTMGPLMRSMLLLSTGLLEEAATTYAMAGPVESWSLPAFAVVPGHACAALVAAGIGRHDDLTVLLDRLEPFRGEHASTETSCYLGPVELALGRGAAALGLLDRAVDDLTLAVDRASRAGARGFVAEASYHLATTLLDRDGPDDVERARRAARTADRLARELGMSRYAHRARSLVTHLDEQRPAALSPREEEVAGLVAEGLTNRQIAQRLVISDRTAQNHVQHILTKLGFRTRSQIAAWNAGLGR